MSARYKIGSKVTQGGRGVEERMVGDVSGLKKLSRRRRTYNRVPKTDLRYPGFSAVRGNQDFRIFGNILIFPDRKQVRPRRFRCYHWPCGCSLDSFEDFDSHWSRRKRFGRPKLELHGLTHSQNPVLGKSARLGFQSDFGAFFGNFGFLDVGCC